MEQSVLVIFIETAAVAESPGSKKCCERAVQAKQQCQQLEMLQFWQRGENDTGIMAGPHWELGLFHKSLPCNGELNKPVSEISQTNVESWEWS